MEPARLLERSHEDARRKKALKQVLLVGTDREQLERVAEMIRAYGLSVGCTELEAASEGEWQAEVGVLVASGSGSQIAEQLATARESASIDRLLVCCRREVKADRLRKKGADEVLSPRSWTSEAVAERIAASLLLLFRDRQTQFGKMIGASPAIRKVQADIERWARFSDPLLIRGETGSGKELVSRELHERSGRAGNFVAENCASIRHEVFESELFGHARGAFTGAQAARGGLILEADGGTLFLDEVGDLDLVSQAKLLRVLEEKSLRPMGADRSREFDTRFLFATHRDLEMMVENGKFRDDLLQRINGFEIEIPPLRRRRGDILILAEHFLREVEQEMRGGRRPIPEKVQDLLVSYEWPRNVRQLRKVIRRAATYAEKPDEPLSLLRIEPMLKGPRQADADCSIRFDPHEDEWKVVMERCQKRYLREVLLATKGDRTLAIEKSGLSRGRFYELLTKYEIPKKYGR